MTKNKKIILLVEDDVPLLEAAKLKLEKNGFEVISARSVERAISSDIMESDIGKITADSVEKVLKHLENLEKVDAIWLDHNLIGKENGLDFVAKFKSNGGRFLNVPIFVVSNTSSVELRKSYEKIGVRNYFVKAEHRLENIVREIRIALNFDS